MRFWRIITWVLVATLIVPAASTSSQESADACPQIVSQALALTHELCESTRRNQACYGHVEVEADPQSGIRDFRFHQEGDITDLSNLRSLRLSPMNLETLDWGVSLLRVQANLPDSRPGQNVTLITFGDVTIEDATSSVVQFEVTATTYLNVRRTPNADQNNVLHALEPGEALTATGRLADASWLRVLLPEDGASGWLFADLITSEHDLATLAVVPAGQPYYRPFQAFYFQSAVDDTLCPEAAESGLLIQTPAGVGRVRFLVNEVSISLGSTAFLQAQPGQAMTVSVLEGEAQLTAQGVVQDVLPGTQVTVALDAHLKPSGPPVPPLPYQPGVVDTLPLEQLERPVEPPEPMSVDAINQVTTTRATQQADQLQAAVTPLGSPIPTLDALDPVDRRTPTPDPRQTGTPPRDIIAAETLVTRPALATVPGLATAARLPTATPAGPVLVPATIDSSPIIEEPILKDSAPSLSEATPVR
jgi:hypothetical protein